MKKSRFVAWTGLALALTLLCVAGCGRQRQPNVPPGEERVFRKTAVSAETGPGTPTRVEETLSEDELRRRNAVRQIADQFKNAKTSDDRLDALGNLDKNLSFFKGRAPELVPYVARCLTDPDPDMKIYGIRARAAISPKDALPDIKLVLRDADPKVRQAAVEAFLMLPDPLPFDALFAHLESERDPYVQQAVMVVIASRGDETQLTRVLGHVKDLEVKAVAPVVELARKYPAVARPRADVLAYFLDRNEADLRMQVAKLLGEWGIRTQPVLSGLVRALNDNELSVRRAAIQALKTISDNQDLGYNPEADAKARQEAVGKWKAWAKEAGDGAESAPTSAPTSR